MESLAIFFGVIALVEFVWGYTHLKNQESSSIIKYKELESSTTIKIKEFEMKIKQDSIQNADRKIMKIRPW